MKWKLIEEQPRIYAVIFETGDEISAELKAFAKQNQLRGSRFKAIGALSHAEVGWFNWETKKYETRLLTRKPCQRLAGITLGFKF